MTIYKKPFYFGHPLFLQYLDPSRLPAVNRSAGVDECGKGLMIPLQLILRAQDVVSELVRGGPHQNQKLLFAADLEAAEAVIVLFFLPHSSRNCGKKRPYFGAHQKNQIWRKRDDSGLLTSPIYQQKETYHAHFEPIK